MARPNKRTACGYCGTVTDKPTRDHAIPSSLWPVGKRPKHPVIVLACCKCHTELDREVPYFRDMIVLMADPDSHELVERMASGPVARNINRDYNLREQIIN